MNETENRIRAVCIVLIACLIVMASCPLMQEKVITGLAAAEEPVLEEKPANATKADALKAIEQAKKNMQEMQESGFGIVYINDTILSAKRVFERAGYIELLKKKTLTGEMMEKAKEVFEEGIAEGVTYSDVLKYTAEVSERKASAYRIDDALHVAGMKAEDYAEKGVETAKATEMLAEARSRFNDEMYEDAEKLIAEADAAMESGKAELTLLNAMAKAGKSFLQRNWKTLSVSLGAIIALGIIAGLKIRKAKAKKRLETLKVEKEVIVKLMKETQRKRFSGVGMSSLSYDIRMDKFKERLTEISHTMPVLEAIANGEKAKKAKP